MNLTDSRLAQAGNERLELAMLSFFEQFRKIYIGDQVQKSSKVNAPPPGTRSVLTAAASIETRAVILALCIRHVSNSTNEYSET